MDKPITIYGVKLPLIEGKCDLAEIIVDSVKKQGLKIEDGDVIVITCKIVSKALGLLVKLDDVKPSMEALKIASKVRCDPRFVELVLRETDDILAAIPVRRLADERLIDLYSYSKRPEHVKRCLEKYPTIFLVLRDGSLWTDSGLDSSNHPPGVVSIPPRDLDEVAKMLRDRIKDLTGKDVAVVISDTEIFLTGSLDFARGSYGIEPIERGFGELDLYGKPKFGGVDAIVHEICAAAALMMRQTSRGIPVVIIKGLDYERCECGYHDRVKMNSVSWARILKHIIRETRRVLGLRAILRIILGILV
ncbi:MAG: hypothetical protein DRN49_04175 [Thaumarchaeota archaeon]|nr:MAG: hypothetical protein DRN49_04175 [Nitrososphaerota archaeon]